MTPTAKAKKLFEKYSKGKDEYGWFLTEFDSSAKQCALIAVDEIIKELTEEISPSVHGFRHKYYQEVKQEIEKL